MDSFINLSEHAKTAEIIVAKEDEGKEKVLEMMAAGKIGKFFEANCLMEQEYVKGDKESVAKYVAGADKNLKVTGFIRIEKGEGLEKKEENFAEEIAKLTGNN